MRRLRRVGTACVPVICLTVLTCGGREAGDGDAAGASGDSAADTSGGSAWDRDGGAETVDGDARDAGVPPPFTVVDGGTGCDAAPPAPCCREKRTCCNGSVCEGMCVVLPDASAPVCYCAGLSTGCPSPWVCCIYDGPHGTCTSSCPKVGPP